MSKLFTCYDHAIAREVAADLLSIKAIKLSPNSPYTWASGWKSPIYCDNRQTLSYPALRTKIKLHFCSLIKKHFPEADVIAGVATAGIPQGVLIAEELGLSFIYVRSTTKAHGLGNQIEGKVRTGQKVVIIEDLISTGGSSLSSVEAIKNADLQVLGMAAIFTYGFDVAKENFKVADVDLVYLSEYDILIKEALKQGYIQQSDIKLLETWKSSPQSWERHV